MTMRVYRFRAGAPFDDTMLAALTGDLLATIMGSTGGQIVDLLVDDSREDDLIEIMARRNFAFVSSDPSAIRTHDYFAGIESPSLGSMILAQDNFFVAARPVISDTGHIMVTNEGHIMLHSPDMGEGEQGHYEPNSAMTEFARANATAIAKTFTYTDDLLTQILIFGDAARMLLNYTKNFVYVDDQLVEVELIRARDGARWTKTFGYTDEDLTETTIVPV